VNAMRRSDARNEAGAPGWEMESSGGNNRRTFAKLYAWLFPREGRCLGWRACPHAQLGNPPAPLTSAVGLLQIRESTKTRIRTQFNTIKMMEHPAEELTRIVTAVAALNVSPRSLSHTHTHTHTHQRAHTQTRTRTTHASLFSSLTHAPCLLSTRSHTTTKKLRIVTYGFGTARQKMALERGTNRKPQRRTCSPRCGEPSCRGKSAGAP
jgi:hypothetical protein